MSKPFPPINPAFGDFDPRVHRVRIVLAVAFVVSGAAYLGWRTTVFNSDAPIFSAVFFLAELIPFISTCFLLFITFRRRDRAVQAPPQDISIDVFVTTYNEHIDIVRRSLVAAIRIRYPHETWLLDDGNRAAFAAMATELGCRYLARTNNIDAKAGNLNNGLLHARGEFVAVLDGDHCAQPDFLDRVLGHFADPRVAFVQTPQDFYNTDSFQHGRGKRARLIWHEQSRFNHVEQPGRDALDAALMCGCSSVVRRAALDDIGGFATGTVTEDMHTAVRMMKRGWKPAFHDESLAFGIAPPDFNAFTRQRLRWAEGNLQVCRRERLPFAEGLGWRANLAYALLTFYYVNSWRKLVLYIAPVYSLITEVPPVYGAPAVFCAFFMTALGIGIITFKEFSGGFARTLRNDVDAMARMSAGLPAVWGIFRRHIRFRVTPKTADGHTPVLLMLPHLAIVASGVAAVAYAIGVRVGAELGLWTHYGMPVGIAVVISLLTLWNCAIAAYVLCMAWRAARPAPVNYEHVVPLPIRVRGPSSASMIVFTDLLSIESATVAASPALAAQTGHTVLIDLFLPTGLLTLSAQVERGDGAGFRLVFAWPTLALRDELDQALHAGRWHRIVTGRYEAVETPLERFGFLNAPPGRRRDGCPTFEPVLLRSDCDEGLRLGFVGSEGPTVRDIGLILCGEPPASRTLQVTAARLAILRGRTYALGSPSTLSSFDEPGLDCIGAGYFAVTAVHPKPARPSEHPVGRGLGALATSERNP